MVLKLLKNKEFGKYFIVTSEKNDSFLSPVIKNEHRKLKLVTVY